MATESKFLRHYPGNCEVRKKSFFLIFLFILLVTQSTKSQKNTDQTYYANFFEKAYNQYKSLPKGILEAIAYTNTRIHHLSYSPNSCKSIMPRFFTVMGMVLSGQGVFRNNLITVSKLSGYSQKEIIQSPEKSILAYAKAYSILLHKHYPGGANIQSQKSIIEELSYLPNNSINENFPTSYHLYSIFHFLADTSNQRIFKFDNYEIDLTKIVNQRMMKLINTPFVSRDSLSGPFISADYPPAAWIPAASANYSVGRPGPITDIVIHDMEGTYEGTIAWFQDPNHGADGASSAHYLISSEGQIAQMVKDSDMAFHTRSANKFSIGIEHAGYCSLTGFYTQKMYETSSTLVKFICKKYSIDSKTAYNGFACGCNESSSTCTKPTSVHIKGHQMYPAQTHCDPGQNWDWTLYYRLINQ